MYCVFKTSAFERDVKRCAKKHWNMQALKEAMTAVAMSDERSIPLKYKDHALSGNLQGIREIHVESRAGDWVILYSIEGDVVEFARTGTHDEMFRR